MITAWNLKTNPEGTPRPCSACGSRDFEDVVTDRIDYTPCEVETRCKGCGSVHLFWAYGSFDPSYGLPTVEEQAEYEDYLSKESVP